MSGPQITDASLRLVGTARNVSTLSVVVVGASVTDAGLGYLVAVPGLRVLMLVDVPIDDGAVQYLGRMPTLRYLRIDRTRFTKNGIILLKQSLPQTQVLSDIK